MSEVPAVLEGLLSEHGIFVPEEIKEAMDAGKTDEVVEVFQRMLNGCCAMCGAEVGATTLIVMGMPYRDGEVTETHVVMVFCGGQCMQDMQVTGWLNEAYDNIKQQVEFRGGVGGN